MSELTRPIRLVKDEPSVGPCPVGTELVYQVPATLDDRAGKVRAYALLTRDQPMESPLAWRTVQ